MQRVVVRMDVIVIKWMRLMPCALLTLLVMYMWVPLMIRRWSLGGAINYRSRSMDCDRLHGHGIYL